MANMSNLMEERLLKLFFQNEDFLDVGNSNGLRGSTADGVFYIGLHNASPGEGGNQSTNETTYTGYSRVSINRNSTDWSVSSSIANNAVVVTFPLVVSGSDTLTHISIGSAASGAGNLFLYAPLAASIPIVDGATVSFPIGSITFEAL